MGSPLSWAWSATVSIGHRGEEVVFWRDRKASPRLMGESPGEEIGEIIGGITTGAMIGAGALVLGVASIIGYTVYKVTR